MKKLFLALMAVAAIAIVGCNGHHVNEPDDPEAPENRRDPSECNTDTGTPSPHAVPIRYMMAK